MSASKTPFFAAPWIFSTQATRRVCALTCGNIRNWRSQHVIFEGGNYFRNPTLLEFVAENPTRRGTLPDKIVQVTKVILDAGTTQTALDETLLLVCQRRVARESSVQLPLIDLLCDYGADPNWP